MAALSSLCFTRQIFNTYSFPAPQPCQLATFSRAAQVLHSASVSASISASGDCNCNMVRHGYLHLMPHADEVATMRQCVAKLTSSVAASASAASASAGCAAATWQASQCSRNVDALTIASSSSGSCTPFGVLSLCSGRSKVAHSARQVKLSMALGQKEAVNALTPEHYPSLTPATVSRRRGSGRGEL